MKKPGVISASELYTVEEVKSRLGVKESSIREARLRGLNVRKLGRHRMILGKDLMAYLSAQGG